MPELDLVGGIVQGKPSESIILAVKATKVLKACSGERGNEHRVAYSRTDVGHAVSPMSTNLLRVDPRRPHWPVGVPNSAGNHKSWHREFCSFGNLLTWTTEVTVSGSGAILSRRERSTVPIPLRGMEACQ